MENKQTAVEWLDRWFRDNPEATHEEGNKALKQAKKMEKEHAMAFHLWMKENDTPDNAERFFHYSGEDMYNEFLNETYSKS